MVPVHVPRVVRSTSPTSVVPLTRGSPVAFGGAARGAARSGDGHGQRRRSGAPSRSASARSSHAGPPLLRLALDLGGAVLSGGAARRGRLRPRCSDNRCERGTPGDPMTPAHRLVSSVRLSSLRPPRFRPNARSVFPGRRGAGTSFGEGLTKGLPRPQNSSHGRTRVEFGDGKRRSRLPPRWRAASTRPFSSSSGGRRSSAWTA